MLPPAALAPVLDALAQRTAAYGINFIVPLMDPASLALAVQPAADIVAELALGLPPAMRVARSGDAA